MSRKKPIRTASFRAAYEHAVPLKGSRPRVCEWCGAPGATRIDLPWLHRYLCVDCQNRATSGREP